VRLCKKNKTVSEDLNNQSHKSRIFQNGLGCPHLGFSLFAGEAADARAVGFAGTLAAAADEGGTGLALTADARTDFARVTFCCLSSALMCLPTCGQSACQQHPQPWRISKATMALATRVGVGEGHGADQLK
jgi:hypothetical protein